MMKNQWKKLALVMGCSMLVLGQAPVTVHAEEATAAEAETKKVQLAGATDVVFNSDGMVYFKNPNPAGTAKFLVEIKRDGQLLENASYSIEGEWADADPVEAYLFELIIQMGYESGNFEVRVLTFDANSPFSAGPVAMSDWVGGYSVNIKTNLSKPEDAVWSKEGVLSWKKSSEENLASYSFTVLNTDGSQIGFNFGSNYASSYIEEKDGRMIFRLNDFIKNDPAYGATITNGCAVIMQAVSSKPNEIGASDTIKIVYSDSQDSTPVVSAPSEGKNNSVSYCDGNNHDYEWVTVANATTTDDAMEAYTCKTCGHVKDYMKAPNSAYAQFNKDAITAIDKATANGTVTLKTNQWVSFYESVIETLKGRSDVTLVVNYFYKGTRYSMTIPAGADLSALQASEGYYGFRYLDGFFPAQVQE